MWPFKKKKDEPKKTTGDFYKWELCRGCRDVARYYGNERNPWEVVCFRCGAEDWEVVVGRFHYADQKKERFERFKEAE